MHKRSWALILTAGLLLAGCATLTKDGKPTVWGRIIQAAASYDAKQTSKTNAPPAESSSTTPTTTTTNNLPAAGASNAAPSSASSPGPAAGTSYPPTWRLGHAGAPPAGCGMYPTSAPCDDGLAYSGPGAGEYWLRVGGAWVRQASAPPARAW